jgi:small subunit ribosomal protein S4
MFGVMEGQFRSYMVKAFDAPGMPGPNLLRTLERRLDNVVYMLGFADSRKQARQFVNHGHFRINNTKTDIPSYLVRVGDVVSWKESDKQTEFYKERTDGIPKRPIPSWLSLNQDEMTGQVASLPADEDLRQSIDSRLIVEFYSR